MSEKYYEFTTLSAFPELEDQTNLLIEEEFSYLKNHSFKTDFAPLTNARNLSHRYILIDSENMKVVAHIGTRLRDFIWMGETIPVCMIGGVAVKKELQGMGIFKSLMERTIHTLESQCALFLLWTDKHELYEKWDFYLAGKQWSYRSTQVSTHTFHKTLYRDLSEDKKEEIKELYLKEITTKFFSPLRDEEDWKDIESITSTDLYVYDEGYFFMNKGMDLIDIVHESVSRLSINEFINLLGSKGILWHPSNQQVDDHILQDLQLVGLWKINRHPMALKKISHLLGKRIEVQDLDFLVKDETQSYVLKSHELLEEIFGYGNFNLKKESIPIYISGLDSI